jgi:hypothetical protein
MAIECTACRSDNAQKMSLVYEAGISTLDGRATSTGIGLAYGGLGAGVSRSKVKGIQQTALSKKAEPPLKRRLVRNTILYFVGFSFIPALVISMFQINNQALQTVVGVGYLAFAAFHVYNNYLYNKTVYPPLYKTWDQQYMCLKCGAIFIPAN